MYFAEVLKINGLIQLNEFHGYISIVWGPIVVRDVEQASAQSSRSVASRNNAATESADELICSGFIFLNVVGHDFLNPS
jgi:hypothetical protein